MLMSFDLSTNFNVSRFRLKNFGFGGKTENFTFFKKFQSFLIVAKLP